MEKNKQSYNVCQIPTGMDHSESINFWNVTVSVANWDMRKIKADAYIVPDFQGWTAAWWVWGSLWKTNAQKWMQAYNDYVRKQWWEAEFWDVLITKSWWGNSEYLIHAVTCNRYGEQNKRRAKWLIPETIYKALIDAQNTWIKSIVIPALQTGEYGHLDNKESATAIKEWIKRFSEEWWQMDICLVIYNNEKGFQSFKDVISPTRWILNRISQRLRINNQ